MNYWLFKSEPDVFGWDDQVALGDKGGEWHGVRNYQAGSAVVPPLTAHAVIAAPFELEIVGDTLSATPKVPLVPVAPA